LEKRTTDYPISLKSSRETFIKSILDYGIGYTGDAVRRMSKPLHVKFEVPKGTADKAYQVMQVARDTGKIRKGTNETTKAIERGIAKLVLIAEDVDPPQVVAHLPILCEERKIPYLYVPSKFELGRSIGIDVASASASIVDAGEADKALKELTTTAEDLVKGKVSKK